MEDKKLTIDCILKLLDQTNKVNLSLNYIFPSKKLYFIENSGDMYDEYLYVNNIDEIYQTLYDNDFFDEYVRRKKIDYDFDTILKRIKNPGKYEHDIEDFINKDCSVTEINVVFQDIEDINNIVKIINQLRYEDTEKLVKKILNNTYSVEYYDNTNDVIRAVNKHSEERFRIKNKFLHIYSNDKDKLNKYLNNRYDSIDYNIKKIDVTYIEEDL